MPVEKKKNWGHSAIKKILQKYVWSASTATGQTRVVTICKIENKIKFQSLVNLLPHQCHAI
jgi:hypothetical protein